MRFRRCPIWIARGRPLFRIGLHAGPREDELGLFPTVNAYESAAHLYAQATADWEEHDALVELAYALLGLGRCHLALGRGDKAASALSRARKIFETLNAESPQLQTARLLRHPDAPS